MSLYSVEPVVAEEKHGLTLRSDPLVILHYSPTHTYSGSYVSNTKGSALRDAGCVVRVGQGVLSGASVSEQGGTLEYNTAIQYRKGLSASVLVCSLCIPKALE